MKRLLLLSLLLAAPLTAQQPVSRLAPVVPDSSAISRRCVLVGLVVWVPGAGIVPVKPLRCQVKKPRPWPL